MGSSSLLRDQTQAQHWEHRVLATGPPGKSNVYLLICSLSTLSAGMLTAWGQLGHWFLLSCVPRSLNNAWHRTEVNKCLLNEWMPNQYLFPHLDFLLKWRDGSLLVHPMTRLCWVTDLSQFPGTFPGLALKVQCPRKPLVLGKLRQPLFWALRHWLFSLCNGAEFLASY